MTLSRLSIAAIGDLGYQVDLSKADSYSLPSRSAAAAMLARSQRATLEIPPFETVDHLD